MVKIDSIQGSSLAIEHNTDTRRVAVPELQARLIKMGACLPNAGK